MKSQLCIAALVLTVSASLLACGTQKSHGKEPVPEQKLQQQSADQKPAVSETGLPTAGGGLKTEAEIQKCSADDVSDFCAKLNSDRFDGRYASECESGNFGEQHSRRYELSKRNGEYVFSTFFFNGNKCGEENKVLQYAYEGEFIDPQNYQVQFLGEVKSVFIQVYTAQEIQALTGQQMCGVADWNLGMMNDVTGLECVVNGKDALAFRPGFLMGFHFSGSKSESLTLGSLKMHLEK